MLTTTPAILISSLNYGENSRIFRCYTRSLGIRSFIVKNRRSGKNRNSSLFNPLNRLEITFNYRRRGELHCLKEAFVIRPYRSLYENPFKSGIVFFLAEVLYSVLKEEEPDEVLFDFILESLDQFDEKEENYSDFHLWFLGRLTHYLGFYPNLAFGASCFDMLNGVSSDTLLSDFYIEKEPLRLFEKLFEMEFTPESLHIFRREERKTVLEVMMNYYSLHSSNFRRPKSLEVLGVIFE